MEEVKRWSVMYTKHLKQKRKVYHDGFLELRSSTHKIVLYDDCESVLDSRFVKKDEVIQSSEAIAFDSYLVDIDHLEGDLKTITNVNYERTNKKVDQKPATFSTRRRKGFSSPVLNKVEKQTLSSSLSPSQKIIRGECHYEASQRIYDSSVDKIVPTQTMASAHVRVPTQTLAGAPVLVPTQTLASAPVRAASDILNLIKRPVSTIKVAQVQSSSLEKNHVEGSHSLHSEDKILKEDLVQDLKCQPDAIHCPSLCKQEVDSLSTTPGRPDVEAHSHIGGFSEDNTISSPRSREKCLDSSNGRPTSPIAEIPEEQTGQLPAGVVCSKYSIPSKDVKVENIEQCTDLKDIKARRDEASGVDLPLPVQISSSLQSPFVISAVSSEQEMAFWKMDDAPNFDLGF